MYHGDKKKKMAMGGMYIGAQPRQKMMIGGMAAKGLFGAGKNLVGQLFDDKKGVNLGQVAQAGMQGAVSGIPVVGGMAANALQQTPFMQRFQQMKGGMNGVKLMKGGAVYAQDGVNTNGANRDTEKSKSAAETYFGRPEGLNIALYTGDQPDLGRIRSNGEYQPGALNVGAIDIDAINKAVNEAMAGTDLAKNVYGTDFERAPFTVAPSTSEMMTDALRQSEYATGFGGAFDYFPVTEQMKKERQAMTERLGGLGQFQHKGKRFEPAGYAGGTKAIMSPDILGYYKPGSAYTSGEALASAAESDPRLSGFSEATFSTEAIADAFKNYGYNVPKELAEAVGAEEGVLFKDLSEEQRLKAADLLGGVPMYGPREIARGQALGDVYDATRMGVIAEQTGINPSDLRKLRQAMAQNPDSPAFKGLQELFYPEILPEQFKTDEAQKSGRQRAGGRAPSVKLMKAGGYNY